MSGSHLCPVYRAEIAARAACPVLAAVVPDPQAFVAWVTRVGSTFVKLRKRWRWDRDLDDEPVGLVVGDGRTTRALAWPGHQCIEIPAGPVDQTTLLHELAHLCLPDDEGHSARFAAVHLRLTREWLGQWAGAVLARAYKAEGVL